MQGALGGRYEIIHKIGGGGMAIVFLAKDLFLDRQVAVKVLRDEYIEDPEFVRHFHKEAKSVAALNHPNIVNIYDFDANADPIYLVMEYVEGRTLKQIVVDDGALPWDQVADIGIQIASGLSEAHRNQIVHKDVKSHNILIDNSGLVKITDFGIAQMLSNTTITHNKGILGSAHYFSPEQARGDRVDEKTDIYSLGIVLYEMLTGQVPFTGDNPVTVALKHIQEKPIPPTQYNPSMPQKMEKIVMTCLEKDKNKRFSSMSELAQALEAVRGIDSIENNQFHKNLTVIRSESVSNHPADETLALPKDLTQKQVSKKKKNDYILKKKKGKNRFNLLLIVLIIIVAAIGTLKFMSAITHHEEVIVPSVVDLKVDNARSILNQEGLKIDVVEEVFNDEVEAEHIISQNPESGSTVREGRVVTVVVSKGTEKITVPDLSNKTVDDAKLILKKKELEIGEISNEYDESVPEGKVCSQSPGSEEKVEKNTKIDITVSMGPKPIMVTVPDLRGQTLDEAKIALQNIGLTIGSVSDSESNFVEKGQIISQSLEPGTETQQGTSVTIVISKGSATPVRPSNDSARVQFTVPEDGLVVVQQNDNNGTQLVHSGQYSKGDYFSQSFVYSGTGTIKVFLNDREIETVPLN